MSLYEYPIYVTIIYSYSVVKIVTGISYGNIIGVLFVKNHNMGY